MKFQERDLLVDIYIKGSFFVKTIVQNLNQLLNIWICYGDYIT